MPNPEPMDRIEEKASLWAARLRGRSMTDDNRAALNAWLEADPEHQWVLGRYRELSAQLDTQLGPTVESMAVMRALSHRRRWKLAGMALAAVAGVAIVIWTHRARDFSTELAERHVATLTDGSRVELNAQTALAVNFQRSERRVRLTRGEALFSVAKDPARPFIVETPTGVVRVTGTVFNVRAVQNPPGSAGAGAQTEVTVLEGTVRLRATNVAVADEAVAPGWQALMSSGQITVHTLPDGAAQDVVAWRLGQVVFEDEALGGVIERFAAYHATAITIDPDAAGLRLGGRYHLDDLDGLLQAIERVLPVKVLRNTNGDVRVVVHQTRAR